MMCPRRDKWFRACKFEPRYDLSAPDLGKFEKITVTGPIVERFRHKTYCGDVCVRCGRTVHPTEGQPK